MGPVPPLLCILLLAAAGGAATVHDADGAAAAASLRQGMLEVIKLEDGTTIQAVEYIMPSKASALPYLFSAASVEVHCPGHRDMHVFTGRSMEQVRAAYARGDHASCGIRHLFRESPNCTVAVPPYGTTYVAVAKPRSWLAGEHRCKMDMRVELSWLRMVAAVVGAGLFWAAGGLSESIPFRLTGGTLGFMALSSIILLFILYRRVPHKGKLLAGTAVFGSSFLASIRWLFGVWLPSLQQVLRHPVAIAYLVLSGLSGLAVTYYYNNTENRKVNTMLRVALQLAGLASVYLSATMTEASVALCVGLLGLKAWAFLQQHRSMGEALASAKRNVQQQLAEEGPGAERGAAGQPAPAARGEQVQQHATPVVVARVVAPEVSPLIQRGLVLNEETGHIIGVGKATYNRLVEAGYVVDRFAGTITPPPPSPDSPARRSRGSGRGKKRRTP